MSLQPDLDVHQSLARFRQPREFLTRGTGNLARCLAKRFSEPGDHLRVDRIILCQTPGRQRKIADPPGIDNPYLDAGVVARCAIRARNRRLPPSPLYPLGTCEARQSACGALGDCSGKSAAI